MAETDHKAKILSQWNISNFRRGYFCAKTAQINISNGYKYQIVGFCVILSRLSWANSDMNGSKIFDKHVFIFSRQTIITRHVILFKPLSLLLNLNSM